MTNLAEQYGWSFVESVAQDGSTRRYDRVEKNRQTAILMSVNGDTPGHRIDDFVRIGAWLRDVGLSAPEIYEAGDNFLLLEDFGRTSFKDKPDYELAVQVLDHLAAQECPLQLPHYYDSHVHQARDLIIKWYVPALRGSAASEEVLEDYLKAWDEVESALPSCPEGFLHIDYHAENLMHLPDRAEIKQCGILDFQGAMIGPQIYDLVNLLEDMRVDVDPDLRAALLSGRRQGDLAWYRVLGTQFHCRLIGQCVRWAVRDDKPGYMHYLPRLFKYVDEALKEPILLPLAKFFEQHSLSFEQVPELDLRALRGLAQE